jgi:transposase
MQDRQLYQQILGLTAPWCVSRVELKLDEVEVHVWLEHEAGAEWCCPECGRMCPLYDHSQERTWRHLDTCQFQTLVHASAPRSECPEHGVRVVDDRKRETLDAFYQSLSQEQLCGIQAVAMDMWDPYVSSTRAHVPDAGEKIVFDKFHIAKHLNEAVDKVRRREHKELQLRGDERLKGTKHRWLKNPRNFTFRSWREFAALRESELKTARAWSLKETAMHLWEYRRLGVAKRFFGRWYNWAIRSRLEPLKDVARMLKRRLQNVLTYVEHRITNAQSESLNSKIQWIKYTARGFRSREGFRNAIYFHCGGLDLYPEPVPTQ